MTLTQASIADLDDLTPLFDGYRQFYGRASDVALARAFLQARFENAQSVVFIARDEAGAALGFTQLFPSFSSVSAARIFVLNDLFVTPGVRGTGVGGALLTAAAEFAAAMGAVRLTLSTAEDNRTAQGVYEHMGWTRDVVFRTYNLALQDPAR